jgi:2'-5' RNA ligase
MASKSIINITFDIANPLHKDIIEVSKAIKENYNSKWYIDDKRYHLHFSMYLFAMPSKNKDKLIKIAQKFTKNLKSIPIKSTKLVNTKSGLLMLNFEKTQEINNIHLNILKAFNPIRENKLRDKQYTDKYQSKLTTRDRELLVKYGHRYVKEKYMPHITIANPQDYEERDEIISTYNSKLANRESSLTKFQILDSHFGEDDRTEVIFEKELK